MVPIASKCTEGKRARGAKLLSSEHLRRACLYESLKASYTYIVLKLQYPLVSLRGVGGSGVGRGKGGPGF
jgi:hypothetical protein